MSTKDWLEKDYYKILGVSADARPDEIKQAVRTLAREFHPDQNAQNPEAEKRFKEVSEANSVLSDAAKRKEYDEARKLFGSGFRFPRGGQPGGPSPSVDDLVGNLGEGANLGDLFGGLFGGTRRSPTSTRGPRRGTDIEGEVQLDFVAAVEGATVSMKTVSDAACEACHGTGARAGSRSRVCPTCQGSGMQTASSAGMFSVAEPCRECRGRENRRQKQGAGKHEEGLERGEGLSIVTRLRRVFRFRFRRLHRVRPRGEERGRRRRRGVSVADRMRE